MDGDHEATAFEGDVETFLKWGRHWGAEGWEILSIAKDGASNRFVAQARRLRFNWPSWEYHFFHTGEMPSVWFDHIESCGWSLIDSAIYSYSGGSYYMAKRPGVLAGSDDGDIVDRLNHFGFYDRSSQTIREILELKWNASQAAGINIGTYRSVVQWLVSRFIPAAYASYGVSAPDEDGDALLARLSQHSSLDRQIVRDVGERQLPLLMAKAGVAVAVRDPNDLVRQLLDIRKAMGNMAAFPSLDEVIGALARDQTNRARVGNDISFEEFVAGVVKYRGDRLAGKDVPEWASAFWEAAQARQTRVSAP